MLLTIVPKVCFICGTYGTPKNKIERHHVVPKKLFNKPNMDNVTIPLCCKCHHGVHTRYRGLRPNQKIWRNVKSILKLNNDRNKLIQEVIYETIINNVNAINDYHRFLDYQECHKHRLH